MDEEGNRGGLRTRLFPLGGRCKVLFVHAIAAPLGVDELEVAGCLVDSGHEDGGDGEDEHLCDGGRLVLISARFQVETRLNCVVFEKSRRMWEEIVVEVLRWKKQFKCNI